MTQICINMGLLDLQMLLLNAASSTTSYGDDEGMHNFQVPFSNQRQLKSLWVGMKLPCTSCASNPSAFLRHITEYRDSQTYQS